MHSYIMARITYMQVWWWYMFCSRPTRRLLLRHDAPPKDIIVHPKPIIWSYALKLHISIQEQAANTNYIVFPLTRQTIEPTIYRTRRHHTTGEISVRVIVFNTTCNVISVIEWRSVLLSEETGCPGENHPPVASHWQTLSHISKPHRYKSVCD